ncbi:hypothetical protein [Nonomuraea basaltis]|uniref:hypothetical protein n=1 Tax=Nonomuraea basaltis TaxID=2495887 RepID=UPI00110C52CD|nr:hypothetical protein [Nonomuraea basaltis]TMR87847.1 hypothetical protein EJK15_69530 [Nonomuraea basaltis]
MGFGAGLVEFDGEFGDDAAEVGADRSLALKVSFDGGEHLIEFRAAVGQLLHAGRGLALHPCLGLEAVDEGTVFVDDIAAKARFGDEFGCGEPSGVGAERVAVPVNLIKAVELG